MFIYFLFYSIPCAGTASARILADYLYVILEPAGKERALMHQDDFFIILSTAGLGETELKHAEHTVCFASTFY